MKVTFNKYIETKRAVTTSTDGVEIGHNFFISRSSNLVATSQGIEDPISNSSNSQSRLGDEVMLQGVSNKMMLELNERYSDVPYSSS